MPSLRVLGKQGQISGIFSTGPDTDANGGIDRNFTSVALHNKPSRGTVEHGAKAISHGDQVAAEIATRTGITKKSAVEILEYIADLAYKNAKNSFTIPSQGKLVLVNRKSRMGRNPVTGVTIKIAAKRVVKFRVAKSAKDAILGAK